MIIFMVFAEIQELLPGILNQMGPDSLHHLKKMMAQVLTILLTWCCISHQTSILQAMKF